MTRTGARPTELSAAKRAQILGAACELFRELGYERTSVDAIAARATVSKATVYNHFQHKAALFLATFGAGTNEFHERFLSLLETPTGDIEGDLRRIAEQLLRLVTSQSHICRYRIVAAEVGRFPEIGKALYESGVLVAQEKLKNFFELANAGGLLQVEDPAEAAVDFQALACGDLPRLLHLGILESADDALIAGRVDRAVRTFLRAYRPPDPGAR